MENNLTGHKTKDGMIVRCTVHGISRCTNCVTQWNRSCSATRNLHAVTKFKLSNWESATEGFSDCFTGWMPRIDAFISTRVVFSPNRLALAGSSNFS